MRNGAPAKALGIHKPYGDANLLGGPSSAIPEFTELLLYHFDSISFERWQKKWLGRIKRTRTSNTFDMNKATVLYTQAIAQTEDESERMKLFGSLYSISNRQAAFLKAVGQLRRKELWPK